MTKFTIFGSDNACCAYRGGAKDSAIVEVVECETVRGALIQAYYITTASPDDEWLSDNERQEIIENVSKMTEDDFKNELYGQDFGFGAPVIFSIKDEAGNYIFGDEDYEERMSEEFFGSCEDDYNEEYEDEE